MTAKDARHRDDWGNDPHNPVVPFRMSDRLDIYGLKIKMNVLMALSVLVAGLVGSGMALRYW